MFKKTTTLLLISLIISACTSSKQGFIGYSLIEKENTYLGIAGDFELVEFSGKTNLMILCYYATKDFQTEKKISRISVQVRMKYTPKFDIRDANITVSSSTYGEFIEKELERNEFYNANPSREFFLEVPENADEALRKDQITITVDGVVYKYVYKKI